MNDFKEWLSDYLRYFLLAFIILLIIGAAILGVSIYSKVVMGSDSRKDSVKQEAAVTDTESFSESEEDTKEESESQGQTETTTEVQTEPQTEVTETKTQETQEETENLQTETPQTEAPQTETPATEPETEAKPVYLTMQGSCYLRAEPDIESDIIGEYWVGTTVEFLEDVGGWYKVRVDGKTGYMGARFF